jgi:general secretion pathway protein E
VLPGGFKNIDPARRIAKPQAAIFLAGVGLAQDDELLRNMPEVPPMRGADAADAADKAYAADMPLIADAQFVERVSIGFARRHGLLGLASGNGHLPVMVESLEKIEQLEAVGRLLGRAVRPVVTPREQILAAINQAYQQQSAKVDGVLQSLDRREVLEQIRAIEGREDLLDSASRAPVIKLVNLMLFEAVKQEASDVHIQPYEDRVVVRIRVDGMLFNGFELPKTVQEEMVGRIKVMGKMDIAEKRLPQDGRATVQVGERVIDLRIASLPTNFGERLVIRLLDKSAKLYRLDDVGMDAGILERFRRLISRDHGLILVTGPTGSGKTTTLYSAMLEMDGVEHNILTLEDPIEYQLPGVSQTQVSTKKGMTFASGLRSVLRQDPDIIMVGEIRDHETANITIQSALTGHLVFSTLHTNDAAGAVARLLDLGIEPYLVASSVAGVLAQRLVRRVCPDCAQPCEITDADWIKLGAPPRVLPNATPRRGSGCAKCRQTGFRGRIGLFELLSIDDAVRRLVSERAPAAQIQACSRNLGIKSLLDDGIEKIAAGITTPDEVARVASGGAE